MSKMQENSDKTLQKYAEISNGSSGYENFKVYYDDEADLDLIRQKKVAMIGYGSQGHAHALNLRDQEVSVVVGLHEGSKSWGKAEKDGFKVVTPRQAAEWADVIMMLVPDEVAAGVYKKDIEPVLHPGKALVFAHGLNVHFGKIVPPSGVGVFLVAPKGPGHMVRRLFVDGKGVPGLVAVCNGTGHDEGKKLLALALSYAKGIGATRAGVFETSFKEETETDLFGEQAVLCGGLTQLMQAGFYTLVKAGYSPVMAYFECVHEMKLIVDLIYEGGLTKMRESISNTAEYGDYTVGPKVIDQGIFDRMKTVLSDIQKGQFADEWLREAHSGGQHFSALRNEAKQSLLEGIGSELRDKMSCVLNQQTKH